MEVYNRLVEWLQANDIEPGWFLAVIVPTVWAWFAGTWQTVEWSVGTYKGIREWLVRRSLARLEVIQKRQHKNDQRVLKLFKEMMDRSRVLEQHENSSTVPQVKYYRCAHCGFTTTDLDKYDGHEKPSVDRDGIPKKCSNTNPPIPSWGGIIPQPLPNYEPLSKSEQRQKNYMCPQCNFHTDDEKKFTPHKPPSLLGTTKVANCPNVIPIVINN